MDSEPMSDDIFDAAHYPLDRPNSTLYADLVGRTRSEIREIGYGRLAGFVSQEIVTAMAAEV